MIQKIVGVKDPALRKKSINVKKFDKKLKILITDLKDTLVAQKDPTGVGLAAPQLGKNVRVFVMKDKDKILTLINPEIVYKSTKLQNPKKHQIMEGCLSLVNYYGPIARAEKIRVKYFDEEGREQQREFSGFSAQIVQHELDHLEGNLFIDRILEQKAKLYKVTGNEWEEVELT